MKLLGINTVDFFEFQCNQLLLESVLEQVKKLNFVKNKTNQISDNENQVHYFHNELFDWFDSCLLEVKQQLNIDKNIQLPIVSCWVNKAKKLQGHHIHSHRNSFASGIFYLTTHETGRTFFYHDNQWFSHYKRFTLTKEIKEYMMTIKPEAGKLIIFPSHITHSVGPLMLDEPDRYTIAFNTFFEGSINDYQTLDFSIKVKTVREMNEDKENEYNR